LLTRVGIALLLARRAFFRQLRVTVEQQEVTLQGQLPSLYDRMLAVDVIRRMTGVTHVHDQIADVEEVATAFDFELPQDCRRAA
jgi:osmotically-inducible protein OsmY